MQKLDLIGLKLTTDQERIIKIKLEQLADRAPFTSAIYLKLEKRKSCIKGHLKIQSFSENFTSSHVASDPIQTFLQLVDDIDGQLLDWKRCRFKAHLINNLGSRLSERVA